MARLGVERRSKVPLPRPDAINRLAAVGGCAGTQPRLAAPAPTPGATPTPRRAQTGRAGYGYDDPFGTPM